MKKIMQKKVKIFEKEISVFLIAMIAVIGVGTAALVPYLSTVLTGGVTVESPMTCGFDTITGPSSKSFSVVAGEDLVYRTVCESNIDNLPTYPVTILESENEWSGNEFNDIILKDNNYPDGISVLALMKYIDESGSLHPFSEIGDAHLTRAKIIFDNGALPYLHPEGTEVFNEITVETKLGLVPGQYTIEFCHLEDLTKDCEEL
jgi:hypothetical protein